MPTSTLSGYGSNVASANNSDCEPTEPPVPPTSRSGPVPLRRRPLTTDFTAQSNGSAGVAGGVGVGASLVRPQAQQLRPLSLGPPTPTPSARRTRTGVALGRNAISEDTPSTTTTSSVLPSAPASASNVHVNGNARGVNANRKGPPSDLRLHQFSSSSSVSTSTSTPTPQTPTVRLQRIATVEDHSDDADDEGKRKISSGSSYNGLSGSEADLGQYNNDEEEGPPPKCPIDHAALVGQGRQLINTIIPGNVDTIFGLFFTNSKFFMEFQNSRKSLDVKPTEWEAHPETKLQTRTVSLTVSLNQRVGPKHSQLKDTLTLLPESKPGFLYAIDTEALNSGVPLADKFLVASHFCLERVSSQSTHFVVICQIKYREKVWPITKSIIEQKTWEGLTDFYSHLERALKEECLLNANKGEGDASHEESSRPPTGPLRRKKYRAPPAPGGTAASSRNGSPAPGHSMASSFGTRTTTSEASQSQSLVGIPYAKIIMGLLALCLIIQNMVLHVKLGQLETSFAVITDTGDQVGRFSVHGYLNKHGTPRTHEEWLGLLKKQETAHKQEVYNWQENLLAALDLLKKAEDDLQLHAHILEQTHTISLPNDEDRENPTSKNNSNINYDPAAAEASQDHLISQKPKHKVGKIDGQ